MTINSNRYNPIASTGSGRYNPISAVSEVPTSPISPEQLQQKLIKPTINTDLKISQGPQKSALENIVDTIKNSTVGQFVENHFSTPIRQFATGQDAQQQKESDAQRQTDLNILEGLGKKIAAKQSTPEDKLAYDQAHSNINKWLNNVALNQVLWAQGGMAVKDVGPLEAVTQENFSRINEILPDLQEFAKANPDKPSAQFLVNHLEQSQKSGMINPNIQALVEGKTGNLLKEGLGGVPPTPETGSIVPKATPVEPVSPANPILDKPGIITNGVKPIINYEASGPISPFAQEAPSVKLQKKIDEAVPMEQVEKTNPEYVSKIINPDRTITVYRNVGESGQEFIKPNDYVSFDKNYAKNLRAGGKVISRDIPITDLKMTGGIDNSFKSEAFYIPKVEPTKIAPGAPATQGPGYQKLSQRLDAMVQNKTLYPEDATILKTLFEGTNDNYLNLLNIGDSARLKSTPGYFMPSKKKISMRKGSTNIWSATNSEPAKTFTHEFGHAGYYLILDQGERALVDDVYFKLKKTGVKKLFEGGLSGTNGSANYYAKNPQEFFAESFANYVFENKIPAKEMEPLLKRVAKKFYDALKRLVTRGEEAAVKIMSPLFEKILKGDKTTPLSDFENPTSFKQELQTMFDNFDKPVEPNANGIFVNPNKPPVELPPPSVTKATPPTEGSPIDYGTAIYQTAMSNLPPETPIEPLEKVIQGDERTPLNERVNFIDYLITPWKIFEKMGIRPQYEGLLKAYEGYVKELPKNIDKITQWSKQVSKEGNKKIFQFLDGEKIELNPVEAKIAGEIKTWLSEWADRLGMSQDSRISDYITHIFPAGKGGEIPEEIAFLINKKIPGSVYDPFLLPRQGVQGYIQDTWGALDAYVKRATRKVYMDPALADMKVATAKMTDTTQLNFLNRYLGAVNLRPTELDTSIDTFIKQNVGYLFGTRPTASITRFLRQMIARAKIGGSMTSFAKNLTQGVNTFSELGTYYTARGYLDLVKYGGKELQENGVLIAPFIEDRVYSAVKKAAEKFDNVLFLNMNASELVNRGAAYYGAKAKFLAGKITPKEYKQAFGEPMPAGYKPTLEDAIAYGKKIAAKTQFLFGALDTPVALNSDIAKTAAQFSTFGLKQTEFIADMIGQKNWWKLIRYIASSMLIFTYIGSAFGMKWDDSLKTFKFGAPPAVSFGMDLFNAITGAKDQYGNVPTNAARIRSVEKSIFTNAIPGGSQILRSYEGFKAVDQGASRGNPTKANPQGAYQYSIPQTPMNYVRGTLFGKANTEQGQAYYNKTSSKKSTGTSSSRYNPQ